MSSFENVFRLSAISLLRDRLLYLLFTLALLVLLLIPAFSLFSMRQVQELSVTFCLSALSSLLLVVTLLTGATSIWRDVEKRYTASVLGLPVSRGAFVLGKFCAISFLLAVVALVFMLGSFVAVKIAAAKYPSDIPISWGTVAAAVAFDYLKSVMLLSLTFLFSAVSTSFYFPFLGAIAVYVAGSASQEVFEMINGAYGKDLVTVARGLIEVIYYLLPNFAAFNLKAHAIYSLPLDLKAMLLAVLYFVCYTGLALSIAIWSFSRRELP